MEWGAEGFKAEHEGMDVRRLVVGLASMLVRHGCCWMGELRGVALS